jgi:3-hydroxypropanoate dehydrogenase
MRGEGCRPIRTYAPQSRLKPALIYPYNCGWKALVRLVTALIAPGGTLTNQILDDSVLDRLFRSARSVHTFRPDPVTDSTLRNLYELLKWGPTAFNSQPARYVFVRSAAAKARLAPALSASNREKTIAAPVTVIIAYDVKFFSGHCDQTSSAKMAEIYGSNVELATATAFRNGTLQGAYLFIAARALGLAVGPMSGFDANAVNREFFPDGRYRANFLANMGYADDTEPRPRAPRFEFDDVAEVI